MGIASLRIDHPVISEWNKLSHFLPTTPFGVALPQDAFSPGALPAKFIVHLISANIDHQYSKFEVQLIHINKGVLKYFFLVKLLVV